MTLKAVFALLLALCCSSCTYNPLHDPTLRARIGEPLGAAAAVNITYFGNSTLLISDGKTSLLVDGFFSRPGPLKTLFGKIGPDAEVLNRELQRIRSVDAVLVGHSHHDHALDASFVAEHFRATIAGSRSFANLHEGSRPREAKSRLKVIPPTGATLKFGEFVVRFAPSDHAVPYWLPQRIIKPRISAPLAMPAHYTEFGCGDVFALHIAHRRHGSIAITTTAGSKRRQFGGRKADVVFVSVGMLTKQSPDHQERYWRETVELSEPDLIVPVHWDSFNRKLSNGLKPGPGESARKLMSYVKTKAGNRDVRVLNVRECVRMQNGKVYCPEPTKDTAGS